MIKYILVGLIFLISIFAVNADAVIPTLTKVYFENEGVPYNNTVSFNISCYGYSYSPGPPITKEEGTYTPYKVFSFSNMVNEYGGKIYENYYMNYRHLDYCKLLGKTSERSFEVNLPLSNFPDCDYPDEQSNETDNLGHEIMRSCVIKVDMLQSNICSANSDCYPIGFTPQKCGTFYTCVNNTCIIGDEFCTLNQTCIEKNNSCCKGEVCNNVLVDCISGTTPVYKGCNENCTQVWECIPYNQSAVCTKDCPEVCCNLRGIHVTKCNRCVCEQQYGGVVIGDKKCNKYPSREDLEKIKEARKKLKEDIKQYRGEIKEMLKNNNGWINITDLNITIRELTNNQKEIIANKINARTGLNLTAEDINNQTILKILLSNGRFAEIKILPDRASERAKEVLKAKCEERNCSLELKEVGIGNKTRLAYVVTTNQSSKVLLLFKRNMPLKAQIDAETGEVISIKKPWWAFLAKAEN